MDLRRGDPYVSCIRIRGVPIIPPLMTEDIRIEMRYFKNLARAVEERLRKIENYALSESDPSQETPSRNSVCPTENSSNCEVASESLDKKINADSIIDVPTKEPSIESKSRKEFVDDQDSMNLHENSRESRKSLSDEEMSRREETLPIESASSDVITTSTDINEYLNDSFKSDEISSTLENSQESRKPEVPKTLDIVPIIVDSTITTENNFQDAEVYGKTREICFDDKGPKSTTSPESDETTPKLVRQGSYVLDSPSPMLLAHLQEESATVSDYVPSAVSNSSIKRKEWNISQAKSEWELQRKKEAFVVMNSSRVISQRKTRRNSASSESQAKANGFSTQSRNGGKHFVGTREGARSADCIPSMLYRESTLKSGKSISLAKINGHVRESSKNNETSNLQSEKSVSILSLANKMGGSLGNLGNASARSSKRNTPQKKNVNSRISKSFDSETPTKSDNLRGSTQKLLSAVTSEKLLHVFKEIQNTHDRQMTELVARQQREQRNMEKEFERQQILLLAQIEQTFPGVCLPRLVEKIGPTSPSPSSLRERMRDGREETRDGREIIVEITRPLEINGSHSPVDITIPKCPLDDIYPREELTNLPLCQSKREQTTRMVKKQSTSPPIGLYSTSVLNGERKNYAVSRQLFPLESKTRHMPVINNAMYEERHINAAIVITAYARGYLVRRVMQTERVIALKTTYGEALHCMLKLHVDAPLALPELNFHQRLQLQCDAASMNIVELFALEPAQRMEIINQDRQIKRARQERPNSARSHYSFATQRTLARKRLKEMGDLQTPMGSRPITARSRCQTWTSNAREKRSPSLINQGIKRSTSAGAVRKPWR